MKNITLSVDEKLLAVVRKYADENSTSVNALVREALTAIADKSARSEEAWDSLFEQIDKEGAEVGDRTWSRDDLYVR